jgi:integrase
VSNACQGFFEEDDFRAALRELPVALKPVVEFAYLTGWRIPSEVLRLTWAQLDFEAGIVRLEPRTTKNDEGRTFPFDALPALKRLLEQQRSRTKALERASGRTIPHVFHRHGAPIRYFRRAWLSARDRAAHR